MNKTSLAGLFALLLLFAQEARGQTNYIWNAVNGDWVNNPTDWTPTGPPTSTDTATIASGTVQIVTGDTATAASVFNSAWLQVDPSGTLTTTGSFVNLSGGTVKIEASSVLNAQGQGYIAEGNSKLVLGSAIDFTPSHFYLDGGATSTLEVDNGHTGTIGTVIQDLTGSNSIVAVGSGTLILNQANTYTGSTTVASGVLQIQNNSALSTGTVTVDSGATLDLTNGTVGLTVTNAVVISGTGTHNQGAIHATSTAAQSVELALTGTVTLAANASVGSNTLGSDLDLYTVNLQGNTLKTVGTGRVNLNGSISGTGGLNIDSQVYVYGGNNTFSGGIDVQSGADLYLLQSTLAVPGNITIEDNAAVWDDAGGQFATTSMVTLNGTGAFVVNYSGTETIAGLQSTSPTASVMNEGNSISTSTLALDGPGSYLYAGAISDFGSPGTALVMSGTGTQELDGANTYSDGTLLQNGVLIAGNASALGFGSVSITGGTLMLGNGNHSLTVGSYSQTGGTLELAVNGSISSATNDELNVTNAASLGGTLTINMANFTPTSLAQGTSETETLTLMTASSVTGTFGHLDLLSDPSDVTGTLTYNTGAGEVLLTLTESGPALPPPQTLSLVGLNPNQQSILAPINAGAVAGNANPSFTALFHALQLNATTPAGLASALSQLSPQGFGQFTGQTAFNNATFEVQSMDSYLAGQRAGPNGTFLGGNGAIDTSALTVNDPSYDSNLAGIHSRLLAWSPAPLDHGLLSDSPGAVLGGVDMKEMKSPAAAPPPQLNSWNVFVRGNVILAQGFSDAGVSHFDDNTESVAVGADYRLTPNFLFGLCAGYGHTDATLDDNGSSATVDSYSPGLYASYADHGWYANFVGDYVHNAYTQSRVIGFLGQTADSAPEGDEGMVNLDGGYDFHLGHLTVGPTAGLQYTHLTVNSYEETGSIADLHVNEQQSDSLRSRLGESLSYAFSHAGVSFTPHLQAAWQHEFLDQSRGITSQFDGLGLGSFNVRTDNPSRDSAIIDAGLDAELNQTVTLYVDYSVQAGASNYFGQSMQAGVKIGF